MDQNNKSALSEEESDMYDLPEYIIHPINLEDINAIKNIPTAEEMKKIAKIGFRKIYEGCKNPYLVQNFGYTLDDIPEELLDRFRDEDEEDNALGKTDPDSQEEESDVSVTKKTDKTDCNLNNLEEKKEDKKEEVELIKFNDNIPNEAKQSGSAQSSFQDCYGFNEKSPEKANQNSFTNKNFHDTETSKNFYDIEFNIESVKYPPAISIDKNDAYYLNQKFSRIPAIIAAKSFNFSSIKFNQQMPRHEFYNQQRDLINQMEKADLNSYQNRQKLQNAFESSSTSLVGSFLSMDARQSNNFSYNVAKNCTRSLCGNSNGKFYRKF